MAKHTMQSIAQERMKKMKSTKPIRTYDDEEQEEEYGADIEEKTPASEEGVGKPMPPMHAKGKPEGIAVMIGIGKPVPPHGKPMHGKPVPPRYGQKHPGLGEEIEDEEY